MLLEIWCNDSVCETMIVFTTMQRIRFEKIGVVEFKYF
jgi:hypothetical protein